MPDPQVKTKEICLKSFKMFVPLRIVSKQRAENLSAAGTPPPPGRSEITRASSFPGVTLWILSNSIDTTSVSKPAGRTSRGLYFAFFVRLCGRIVLADLNSPLKGSPPEAG
jgi:hypothetical protein